MLPLTRTLGDSGNQDYDQSVDQICDKHVPLNVMSKATRACRDRGKHGLSQQAPKACSVLWQPQVRPIGAKCSELNLMGEGLDFLAKQVSMYVAIC